MPYRKPMGNFKVACSFCGREWVLAARAIAIRTRPGGLFFCDSICSTAFDGLVAMKFSETEK